MRGNTDELFYILEKGTIHHQYTNCHYLRSTNRFINLWRTTNIRKYQ